MKRLILVGACAAAMIAVWLDFRHYAAGRDRALERIEQHRLDERFPQLRAEVGRRYDPVDAELRVALALLNNELDRSWMAQLGEEQARLELERGPARLAEAAAIARSSWPRRAASWQAAMVLGGATYLQLYRGRDPRLLAESELWERPLLAAHWLAPSETGPVRFLAAAYLGNWSSLTGDQRSATIELLGRAFLDRTTYRLLIRDWLRVAPSRSAALALVPERPWAWEILQDVFATAGDWEQVVSAREKWYETLESDLDRSLAEIRLQVRGGEHQRSRRRLLNLLPSIPRSLDFAPRLVAVLELLPPGPVGSGSAEAFAGWLEWAFGLCLIRDCPFETAVTARLARLAGDLPPDQRALAFVIAGDLPRAELLERRFGQTRDRRWGGYHLLKAEHLLELGRPELAAASLDLLPPTWRKRPRYWSARRGVALAEENGVAATSAEESLEALRRTSWNARDWERDERDMYLTLLPIAEASGLSMLIESSSRRGAVLEIFWDGRLVGVRRIARSGTELELDLPITSSTHRLALRVHSGDAVRPGEVRLL